MAPGNGGGGGAGGGETGVEGFAEKAEGVHGEAVGGLDVEMAGAEDAAGGPGGGAEGSPSAPSVASAAFSPLPALTWAHAETRAMLLETLGEAALSALERAVPTPPLETVFRCVPARGSASEAAALLSARTRAQLSGPAREHDLLPGVLVMPGSGPHRLAVDPSAPAPGEIALDQRAAEAILRGADPFVPGVVAVSAGLEAGDAVLVTAAAVPRRAQVGEEGAGGAGAAGGQTGRGRVGAFAVLTKGAVLEKPSFEGVEGDGAVNGSREGNTVPSGDDSGERRSVGDEGDGGDEGNIGDKGADAPSAVTASERAPSALHADLLTPRLLLATGVAALSRSEILHARSGLAATCSSRLFRAPALGGGELEGRGMLQNLPSIAAARALRPEPHWKVLDACASPGGKSTAIAEMLDASRGGLVVSLDRTHGKVADIRRLAAELGLSDVVRAFRADATKLFAREAVEERLRGKATGRGTEGREEGVGKVEGSATRPVGEVEGEGGAHRAAAPQDGSAGARSKQRRDQENQERPAVSEPRREKKRERGAEAGPAQAQAQAVAGSAGPPRPDEPSSGAPGGLAEAASLASPGNAEVSENASPPTALEPSPRPALPASSASGPPGAATKRSRPSERALAREARREANRVRHGHAPAAAPDREPLLPPQALESFDAALVDAPCSGVGQRPRLAVPHSVRELAVAAAYQKRILRQAVYALKPGGVLVFSTCTVSPFENECNVRWLLDEFPDVLALEDARPEDPKGAPKDAGDAPTRRLGRPGLVGERTVAGLDVAWLQERPAKTPAPTAGQTGTLPPQQPPPAGTFPLSPPPPPAAPLSPGAPSGTVRLLAEHEAPLVRRFDPGMGDDDVIGFFCARFRKRASCFA